MIKSKKVVKNKDADKLLKKAQVLADDIQELESIDVNSALKRIYRRVEEKRWKRRMDIGVRYAAFLTLPLLIASLLLGYLYFSKDETGVQYAEITAHTGSIIRYELPDRSIVWLNAGTTLRYPTVFLKKHREVYLSGEAYFEVKADDVHPFYVNTYSGLKVCVHGTKFDVAAYEDDACITAILEKGKVNVMIPVGKIMSLKPGEQLLYEKATGQWTQNSVDVYEKIAWKDGKMVFRNATLEEVFKRLERHFNVDIELNNSKGKEFRYRATFYKETLPQILDCLSKSTALKWRMEDAALQIDDNFTKSKFIIDLY